jgi:hypothetical protein
MVSLIKAFFRFKRLRLFYRNLRQSAQSVDDKRLIYRGRLRLLVDRINRIVRIERPSAGKEAQGSKSKIRRFSGGLKAES